VRLQFLSEGFNNIDTTFVLTQNHLTLPIYRDESLAKLTGIVEDEEEQRIEGVSVMVQNLQTTTDATGYFELKIPFDQQRPKQRINIVHTGYQNIDVEVPVMKDEGMRLVLKKP